MKNYLFFPMSVFLLASSQLTVRADPDRYWDSSERKWVLRPKGVTQYLNGQRRQLHDVIRQIFHPEDEMARRERAWANWQRIRQVEMPPPRGAYGALPPRSAFGYQPPPERTMASVEGPGIAIEPEVGRRFLATRTTTPSTGMPPVVASPPPATDYSQYSQDRTEKTSSVDPLARTRENAVETGVGLKRSEQPEFDDSAISKFAARKSSANRQQTNSENAAKSRTSSRDKTSTEKQRARADSDNPMTTAPEDTSESKESNDEDSLPYAVPVPGKDGLVYSPFDGTGYVDVKGMPAGSKARCPYSKKVFRVP
jgi:hypothetical protein